MREVKTLLTGILLLVMLLPACATPTPPTVTMQPTSPVKKNAKIFLIAVRQRPRVDQSLQSAGFTTTDTLAKADYALDVRVGKQRGRAAACGTSNNVIYILTASSHRVMIIKGRGATGTCTPNIFDDMSTTLASYGQ